MSAADLTPRHVPVLPAEVLTWLDPQPGQVVVDCTAGAGGHSRLIAERGARAIALDQDAGMIELARARTAGLPVTFVHSGFDAIGEVLRDLGVGAVDGVLAD